MDPKAVLVLLIKELQDQINEIASLKRAGYSANLSMELLKESASILPELDPELKEKYFEYLLILFTSNDNPKRLAISEEYSEQVAEKRRDYVAQLIDDISKAA